jgi:hypothetical protein
MSELILSKAKRLREEVKERLAKNSDYKELLRLNQFISMYEGIASSDVENPVEVTVIPEKQTRKRGKAKALLDATANALREYKRPVTWAEIFKETAKLGFSKADYGKQPSVFFSGGDYYYAKERGGYWHKHEPLPDLPAVEKPTGWKADLSNAFGKAN